MDRMCRSSRIRFQRAHRRAVRRCQSMRWRASCSACCCSLASGPPRACCSACAPGTCAPTCAASTRCRSGRGLCAARPGLSCRLCLCSAACAGGPERESALPYSLRLLCAGPRCCAGPTKAGTSADLSLPRTNGPKAAARWLLGCRCPPVPSSSSCGTCCPSSHRHISSAGKHVVSPVQILQCLCRCCTACVAAQQHHSLCQLSLAACVPASHTPGPHYARRWTSRRSSGRYPTRRRSAWCRCWSTWSRSSSPSTSARAAPPPTSLACAALLPVLCAHKGNMLLVSGCA